jgi:penicillin-binding protein 1A
MLAGVIRGPTIYNPLVDWTSAKQRQKTVLDAMIRDEKITAADAAKAYAEDISPPTHMFLPTNIVHASAFVSYVTQQLVNQFGTEATYSGGLRVVTTLNYKLQTVAQRDVTENIRNLSWRNVTQGALVALDPTTNAILAMVGSANPTRYGGQYNLAVWPPRNPGSSMKIYTYTAAIASKKFTMTTPIRDSSIVVYAPERWVPRNYDGRFHGTCQLQACMGNSLNIPAVKVELSIGVGKVVQMARTMGAPPWQQHGVDANGYPVFTNNDPYDRFGPSLTLGGYGETPLQMATGASVLATQGILRQPFAYTLITKQSGKVVYQHQADPGKRVLDARVAYIMQQMMSNDNNRAMIFGHNSLLTLPGRKVAVKTGTSDSFADAWTVGFTPHLVTAVWGGNPDWRMKMTRGSDSYYIAAPMWHRFMQDALDYLHRPSEWYKQPAGLIRRTCHGQVAWYLPGTHC